MTEVRPFHFRLFDGLDRPVVAIVMPAVLSLLISFSLFLLGPTPQPNVQDEFSYLLAADTYAHGRLTNPSPKLWPFFEAPYVLLQPTYMAKYLPGQGLCLAIGQLISKPIFGAYLVAALSCAVIAWLIGGCLPGRWALLGGCLAALHPTLMWWSQIYWGGGVPLLGGALMTGAAVRWITRAGTDARTAALAGIGASLLLLTRPFEGGIIGLLLTAAMLWTLRHRITRLIRPIAIALLPLIAAFAFLAYSNYRVTGSAWTLPYAESEKQYMSAPRFYWQTSPTPPTYRNAYLAHFYQGFEYQDYAVTRSWPGYWDKSLERIAWMWRDFGVDWRVAALPLLIGLWQIRRHQIARLFVLLVLGLPLIEIASTPYMSDQYMAPIIGAFIAIAIFGYRQVARWPLGWVLIVLLVGAHIGLGSLTVYRLAHPSPDALGFVRKKFIERLRAESATPKLVFVHHVPLPNTSYSDVVYNSANIDAQDIIFARDLGDDLNRLLLKQYANRKAYRLTFETLDLQPYSP